jgi:uncharacterized protein (TIGR00730 family)
MSRVCVFCGSNKGEDPTYAELSRALGRALAARGLGLVYGGASVGLMGLIADTVLAQGGEAIGVIPSSMVDRELAHTGLTRLHVVNTMHERKALMAELSDAFVALPGGLGTLDELFEAATWAYLGIHSKPIGLLNHEGYYDALLAFLDHATAQGFIRPAARALIRTAPDVDSLLGSITPA